MYRARKRRRTGFRRRRVRRIRRGAAAARYSRASRAATNLKYQEYKYKDFSTEAADPMVMTTTDTLGYKTFDKWRIRNGALAKNGDHLVQVERGNAFDERIGDKILVTKLILQGYVDYYIDTAQQSTGTVSNASPSIKLVVGCDTAQAGTGSNLTYPAFFKDSTNEHTTEQATKWFRNMDKVNRYSVLASKVLTFSPVAGHGDITAERIYMQRRHYTIAINRPMVVQFKQNTTSAGPSDVESNLVNLMVARDVASLGTVRVFCQARLYFKG
jgi:hypothetical protein